VSATEEELPDPVDADLPEHLCAIRKLRWLDLLLRMKMPAGRFRVAVALARFGNAEGENVYPGEKKIADMGNVHVTNARAHIKALVGLGLLHLKEAGGGRGGATHVYRLTRPADITTLQMWLDPRFNRVPDGEGFMPVAAEEHRVPAVGETSEHRVPAVAIHREYRVSALGETAEHRALTLGEAPVDNCEDRETPSVSTGNTERFEPEYRALALPEASKNLEEPEPLGLPQATDSLGWRERGPAPAELAALVGPPKSAPWISPAPPAAAAPHAAPPTGPRTYAPDPPPRIVHGSATAVPTAEAAAAFAVLAALPGEGEWWRHAAARELRRDGIPDPTAQDLAIRAAAILRRTDLEKTA
jgi:hypothetical protein